MATTGAPANIPLFDDSSPVTPIQGPLNAMATALNNYLKGNDTGWVQLNLNSGWTAAVPVAYRKLNGVVYLSGQLYYASAPATIAAFSLPAGVRPAGNVIFTGVLGWNHSTQVSSGGPVSITANQGRTTGVGFPLDGLSWIAA